MADDTGRCVNCGFLCKRRTVVDAESIVYTATTHDRSLGTFGRQSGWPDQRDMPTQVTCFRNAANLPHELVAEMSKDEKYDDDWASACAVILIQKPRKCESWYPWTEYLTPKEHFEEYKMNKFEFDRRAFEERLDKSNKEFLAGLESQRREWEKDAGKWPFRLIVAAIILAVAEVVSNVPVIQRFFHLD